MYYRFYVTVNSGRVIVYDVLRHKLDDEIEFLNNNPDRVITYYYKEV